MNAVLGNISLFYNIVEYLQSKEILNLFLLSKSFTQLLNTTYDKVIYKIYKKLYLPLRIKNKYNFDILMLLTIKLIKTDNTPQYIIQKNTQFTTEEIIIRNIIYNIVKLGNITSLYYLLYENGFHQLLKRYIIDKIVISPYECTFSNSIRKTLHYYGNEQTLRMAARFRKHNMIKQILADMEYISKNNVVWNEQANHIFNMRHNKMWFIWCENNVLYESIYNNDYVGFNLITQFMVQDDRRKHFILEIRDSDILMSDLNEYNSELYIDNHTDMNSESHFNQNALVYTLTKNINIIFQNWNWFQNYPDLNSSDFIISDNSNFIISERFLEYINNQRKDIFKYYEQNSRSKRLNQFKLLASILNQPNKVDVYSLIINTEDDYADGWYLIPYLLLNMKHSCHKNIFIIFNIICSYFANFNTRFIYQNLGHIYRLSRNQYVIRDDNYPNTCNTFEFVTFLIKSVYYDDIFIVRDDRFIYFINLLLIFTQK